jgi:hypothetical protein
MLYNRFAVNPTELKPRSSEEVLIFGSAKFHRSKQRFRQSEQQAADIAGAEFYCFLTKYLQRDRLVNAARSAKHFQKDLRTSGVAEIYR